MRLKTWALSPTTEKRGRTWLRMLDEHIALDTVFNNVLESHAVRLVAHTTSDALFDMWLGETAEGMTGDMRSARRAFERNRKEAQA